MIDPKLRYMTKAHSYKPVEGFCESMKGRKLRNNIESQGILSTLQCRRTVVKKGSRREAERQKRRISYF